MKRIHILSFSALILLLSLSPAPPPIKLLLIAEKLTAPVAMDAPKDGTGRIFICEQTGKIKIIKNKVVLPAPFLDVSGKLDDIFKAYSEKGLLGIAFHPKYKANGRFFVYYSAPTQNKYNDHKSILAEYKVSADPNAADAGSEKVIMQIEQPESNHNGGQLAFGPDGFLYVGLGDGGGAGDEHGPTGNGQNLETHLGKILRIDVDSKSPYAVPPDNPFVGAYARPDDVQSGVAKPEIWAYGIRNPWRFSFDRKTGRLFCGDVGQELWEEIDIIEKGKNYGWKIMEGNHCYPPGKDCDQKGLTLPIAEYPHKTGISITGGFVYRGKNIPELQGKYLFADWTGKMFYLEENGSKWSMQPLLIQGKTNNDLNRNINSFGEDEDGEIYVLSQRATGTFLPNGVVYKVVK